MDDDPPPGTVVFLEVAAPELPPLAAFTVLPFPVPPLDRGSELAALPPEEEGGSVLPVPPSVTLGSLPLTRLLPVVLVPPEALAVPPWPLLGASPDAVDREPIEAFSEEARPPRDGCELGSELVLVLASGFALLQAKSEASTSS